MNCAENVNIVHTDFFVNVLFFICLQPLGPSFTLIVVIAIGWV